MIMNRVTIMGRLGKEPELQYDKNGKAVLNFSIAVDRGKKDGNDQGSDWPRCVAFGRTAEAIAKWSGKGKRVAIDGHLRTGSYNSQSGETHFTTQVVVDRFDIVDWPDRNNGGQGVPYQGNQAAQGYYPDQGYGNQGYQTQPQAQGEFQRPQPAPDPQMAMEDIPAGFALVDEDVPF